MRGNIVDMAVGVIVGSSFTAIVNALSDNILKPIINYLLNTMQSERNNHYYMMKSLLLSVVYQEVLLC